MIDNFYQALTVSITFIGGCLTAGWALSREVTSIKSNYHDDVESYKALVKAEFASELWALHTFMKKAEAGKKKFTVKDLMDEDYIDRVTALSGWLEMEAAADDFYKSMWKACSSGSSYMLAGAIFLLPIPFMLFFYTPDFLTSFETLGFLIALLVLLSVYQAGLRVRSYFRNRDRLMDLTGITPSRQTKLLEFEQE